MLSSPITTSKAGFGRLRPDRRAEVARVTPQGGESHRRFGLTLDQKGIAEGRPLQERSHRSPIWCMRWQMVGNQFDKNAGSPARIRADIAPQSFANHRIGSSAAIARSAFFSCRTTSW